LDAAIEGIEDENIPVGVEAYPAQVEAPVIMEIECVVARFQIIADPGAEIATGAIKPVDRIGKCVEHVYFFVGTNRERYRHIQRESPGAVVVRCGPEQGWIAGVPARRRLTDRGARRVDGRLLVGR
jgi:hypothetical protein